MWWKAEKNMDKRLKFSLLRIYIYFQTHLIHTPIHRSYSCAGAHTSPRTRIHRCICSYRLDSHMPLRIWLWLLIESYSNDDIHNDEMLLIYVLLLIILTEIMILPANADTNNCRNNLYKLDPKLVIWEPYYPKKRNPSITKKVKGCRPPGF